MKNLFKSISEQFESFTKDAKDHVEKGNKAAGTRASKTSLGIEKQLKEFRKNHQSAHFIWIFINMREISNSKKTKKKWKIILGTLKK